MNVTIIVPSLNPDEKLLQVIDGLLAANFQSIIVIDDGSDPELYGHYFDTVAAHEECVVLRHAKNLGKGRALKTAFNYYLNHMHNLGVLTVDADNQHLPKDIVHCAQALAEHPDAVILGVRNFDLDHVPPRSKYGNKMTSLVFKLACGLKISDTQTGLRAIPAKHIAHFLDIAGERFEYETNMLLELKSEGIDFIEVEIETIYIEENKSSHFHPLLDSMRISKILFKFLFSSVISLSVDLITFALIAHLMRGMPLSVSVLWATIGSRLISSITNYFLNHGAVFSSSVHIVKSMPKYYVLCILQMIISYFGVYFMKIMVPMPLILIKVLVDFFLFLISFQIQREWVFRK